MTSLLCKRCGKPVSDAYSKSLYCKDCGRSKDRLDNINIMFRAFTIFVIAPVLVAVIFSLFKIYSPLTFYYLITYFVFLTIIGMSLTFYSKKLIRDFEKQVPKMQSS